MSPIHPLESHLQSAVNTDLQGKLSAHALHGNSFHELPSASNALDIDQTHFSATDRKVLDAHPRYYNNELKTEKVELMGGMQEPSAEALQAENSLAAQSSEQTKSSSLTGKLQHLFQKFGIKDNTTIGSARKTTGRIILYPQFHDDAYGPSTGQSCHDSESLLREFVKRDAKHIITEGWTLPKMIVKVDSKKNADRRKRYRKFFDGARLKASEKDVIFGQDYSNIPYRTKGVIRAEYTYSDFAREPYTLYPYASEEVHNRGNQVVQEYQQASNQIQSSYQAIQEQSSKGEITREYASSKLSELYKQQEHLNKELQKSPYVKEDRETSAVEMIAQFNRTMPETTFHFPFGQLHIEQTLLLLKERYPDIPVETANPSSMGGIA